MSRLQLMFVLLMLAVTSCFVPRAEASVTVEVTIAGSSAMWQTMALGAYSEACGTSCSSSAAGHWTSSTSPTSNVVNLTDTRTNPVNVDAGTTWIVWNTVSGVTKIWSFTKVDSVVGDRCYFAQPHCTVSAASANLTGSGSNQISSTLWGDGSSDQALPAAVLALFTSGTPVTVAATDIRPEDANFAVCRVNSLLGSGSKSGTGSD
jgi:hypothetical protein